MSRGHYYFITRGNIDTEIKGPPQEPHSYSLMEFEPRPFDSRSHASALIARVFGVMHTAPGSSSVVYTACLCPLLGQALRC